MSELTAIYLCPRCFSAGSAASPSAEQCPRCGRPRVYCPVGEPDDPVRRPPMDAQGRVLCRAPRWWLEQTTPHLRRAP